MTKDSLKSFQSWPSTSVESTSQKEWFVPFEHNHFLVQLW
jgi:hypothetical protein